MDKETNSFNGMIGMVQRKVKNYVSVKDNNESIIIVAGSNYGNG